MKKLVLEGLVTTAEMLLDSHRSFLEEAFGCPVMDEYGCSEVQAIAFECLEHSMHINADALWVEFLADNRPALPGEMGKVVVTDFFNEAMPVIRYWNGDMGRFREGSCRCGLTLPLMEISVGRQIEMFKLADGRTLYPEVFTPRHESPLNVEEIPRDPSGKLRYFISEVP